MKKSEIKNQDTNSLLKLYKDAADLHGEATEKGNYKVANNKADLIANIYSELRRRDEIAALLVLLESDSPGVRCWSATHTLTLSEKKAKAVLTKLANTAASTRNRLRIFPFENK